MFMKKILGLTLATSLFISPLFVQSTFAEEPTEIDEDLTNNYTIDWESYWDQQNQNSFEESTENDAAAHSFKTLATGSTALSKGSTSVSTTGKTKGKTLSVFTSVTTSLKRGNTVLGQSAKKTSVGTATATASYTVTHRNFNGDTPYTGLSVHTVAFKGILYDAATATSKNY